MEEQSNKSGDQIKAGDRLVNAIDGGRIGDVAAVRPYTGSLIELLGQGTQIGVFHGGMEMTLPAVSLFGVAEAQ
jgi:hypothetical protein